MRARAGSAAGGGGDEGRGEETDECSSASRSSSLIFCGRGQSRVSERTHGRERRLGAHIDESLELALADADLLGELCAGRRVSEARP